MSKKANESRSMEPSAFRFVLRYSMREQVSLLLLTLSAFPFLYLSLDLPKTIINEAIGGDKFPKAIFGYDLDQIPYLLVLCVLFLLLVLMNGAFKYCINVYRGIVGERMLRRLRYQLIDRVLRFPLPQFRKLSQGEIIAMVTAETEDIGGYIGDSIALPAFQGGTLLTILVFMFVQDPVLGTAAIALYPVQAWLIPKLQRKLNRLKKERVFKVRKLSERIGEAVTGIRDVHANDTSQYELADVSDHLGGIYLTRFEIYKQKFLIKFLNNFIAQITPFFFYSIGGYLVIRGNLSFGALVAVLAAYKDLASPWKELLDFYQSKEDARVKYELLLETFDLPGLLDPALQSAESGKTVALDGAMQAVHVDLSEADDDDAVSSTVNFQVDLPSHIAIVGIEGSGKHRLAEAIAGISRPVRGRVTINGLDLVTAPESVTGRQIAYVGAQPTLRNTTVRDNLFYGLMHRPHSPMPGDDARDSRERERRLSGNSPYDIRDQWINYEVAGAPNDDALLERAFEILREVDLEDDVLTLGLGERIDPAADEAFSNGILIAREALRARLSEPQFENLIEPFDDGRYNRNMSVAENLLFGAPRDSDLSVDRLAFHDEVLSVLRSFKLERNLVEIGKQVAALMVDLFAGVEPDSPLFEQYSFISSDDLPMFRGLLSRLGERSVEVLSAQEQSQLLSMALKLTVSRHRLGLIDESIQVRLVEARNVLKTRLTRQPRMLEPFDVSQVNPAVSVQDNILFGRVAHARARGAQAVGELVREVVAAQGLTARVLEAGLDYRVGIAGTRLSALRRQKLSIARALMKRPDVLVMDEATSSFDERTQQLMITNIRRLLAGRSLFWVLQDAGLAKSFERVIVMENSSVAEIGKFAELAGNDGALARLMDAA